MLKSVYIIFFIFSFGLFFIPNEAKACGAEKSSKPQNSETQSCCSNQDSKTVNHKKISDNTCCDKLLDTKKTSDQSHHDCDGHCTHNSCSCASLSFSVNLPQTIDLKLDTLILDLENTAISHDENQLPSGFHSIWLPPVIS
jgi:hypothetical protein